VWGAGDFGLNVTSVPCGSMLVHCEVDLRAMPVISTMPSTIAYVCGNAEMGL
jgi:hypothetical protein